MFLASKEKSATTRFGFGRGAGLMVSALVSGASDPSSSPGRGHCVVFLGKTLNFHSTSFHQGAQMGTVEYNAGGNPCGGLALHRGGVEIL